MTERNSSPRFDATGMESPILSARDVKPIVADLFPLNPSIYWIDLLASTMVAYGGAWIYLSARPYSLLQIVSFVVAGIALFRIATFMHEIAHMRRSQMRLFKIVWNVLVGVPLLTPSLFYSTHADHHSNKHYGTPGDGEYLPFGSTPPSAIIRFLAIIPIVPILAILRALILVPVSLVVPPLRGWLLECASAAVISPTYRRRQVPAIWDPLWILTDLACFGYALSIVYFVVSGYISIMTIAMLYLLILFSIGLNWIRTLAAHRYRNDGAVVNHADQVLDSINITGAPLLIELLFPVGLRYHALHHLLPSLPYHALGKADRRLMTELPADSPYLQIPRCGAVSALRQLWRDAQAAGPIGVRIRESWR
jgi:fatty acid desaturase